MVSVVIPAYNAESTIERSVASALLQGVDVEVIVVDDCSTDGTVGVLESLSREWGNVVVLRNGVNCGVGVSRKRGLDNAHGEWVVFVDADDYLTLGALEDMLSLQSRNDADVVMPAIEIVRPRGDVELFSLGDYYSDSDAKYQLISGVKGFVTGRLFRRSLFAGLPVSERRVGEDSSLLFELVYRASVVVTSSTVCYEHICREGSLLYAANKVLVMLTGIVGSIDVYDFLVAECDERAGGVLEDIICSYRKVELGLRTGLLVSDDDYVGYHDEIRRFIDSHR